MIPISRMKLRRATLAGLLLAGAPATFAESPAYTPPAYTTPGDKPRAEPEDAIGKDGGYFDVFTRGAFDSNNGNSASFGLEAQIGPHFGRHEIYTGLGLAGWFSEGGFIDPSDGKRMDLSRSEWTIPFGYRYTLPVTRGLSLRFGPAGGVVFESFQAIDRQSRRYDDCNGDDAWEALTFGLYSRSREFDVRYDDVKTRAFFGGDVQLAWRPGRKVAVTLGYAYRQYGARNYDFGGTRFHFAGTQEHLFSLGARFDF